MALVTDDLHARNAQSLIREGGAPTALCGGTLRLVARTGAQREWAERHTNTATLVRGVLLLHVALERVIVTEVQQQVPNEDDRCRIGRQQAVRRRSAIAQHLPLYIRIPLVEAPRMAIQEDVLSQGITIPTWQISNDIEQ